MPTTPKLSQIKAVLETQRNELQEERDTINEGISDEDADEEELGLVSDLDDALNYLDSAIDNITTDDEE